MAWTDLDLAGCAHDRLRDPVDADDYWDSLPDEEPETDEDETTDERSLRPGGSIAVARRRESPRGRSASGSRSIARMKPPSDQLRRDGSSFEALIEDSGQQALITCEAPDGQVPPQDALGGADRSDANWVTVASGVPCLVCPKTARVNAFPGETTRGPTSSTRSSTSVSTPYQAASPAGIASR